VDYVFSLNSKTEKRALSGLDSYFYQAPKGIDFALFQSLNGLK
jgi:hypothetical protein